MGVTGFSLGILNGLIASRNIKSVIEFGAQNNYADHPRNPYMREFYEAKGIHYESIDLNGEAGAWKQDLSKKIFMEEWNQADMVTDFGTSEHISAGNIFDWEKIHNCWENKFNLCKVGGIIYSDNPKTGNWPGHGAFYYTKEFYIDLVLMAGCRIISLGDHPAMGNTLDGWEIYCILEKISEEFPTLEQFKTLSLKDK